LVPETVVDGFDALTGFGASFSCDTFEAVDLIVGFLDDVERAFDGGR
jgi:hypothetical protein